MNRDEQLQRCADNIRVLSVAMPQKAKSGHPGGAMGGADFINLLYAEYLVYDPDNRNWTERDRFFLDAGHMSPMLYSTLALAGFFKAEDLAGFRQWGSHTPGHPERDNFHGIENTSGPLGQGHAFGLGAAITERFLAARFGDWLSHKTWCYITDGGAQEEISQGVGRIAGHLGLSNLVMFYDANDVQLSTKTDAVTVEDFSAKYRAWGWAVHEVNGHDLGQLRSAMNLAVNEKEKPTLIIGRTVMGKGARKADGSVWEGDVKQHGAPFGPESTDATVKSLGGDPANPIQIWPDAAALHQARHEELRKIVAERRATKATWDAANAEKSALYTRFFDKTPWPVKWDEVSFGANIATRNASATVLTAMADQIPNMIVASADLADSDKTDAFLKKTGPFKRGDFSGAFLHAGVAELTMAAVCTGMSLHGGVIPACGTFFAFSDYMKPVMRMCALQEAQVIFLWSHDSFRVGEDGPTHQPIEQEAQARLLEQMKNLSGKRSFTVLRPADCHETLAAWRFAVESTQAPTAILLTRQDIPDLAVDARREQAKNLVKGGYTVSRDEKPELLLIGSGSELGLALDAAKLLRAEGLKVQVASIPSTWLFLEQDETYRNGVIPQGIPTLAVTAGLPCVFVPLVGAFGSIVGMTRFGASANFKVLDEKFGYTPEAVATKAKAQIATAKETAKTLIAQAQALLGA
jgi:transketolase